MMGNKSRKTKTRICGGRGSMWAQGMAVVIAESVVAKSVVAVGIVESVVAVVIVESVVAVVRTVTRT
jgi:hypothetical protein